MIHLPEDFVIGAATAAYQIEGTRFGTCGPSHWDSFALRGGTHNFDNGRTACAHYLNWEQDFDLLMEGGFQAYRFSIAWPRIMPQGKGKISSAGLDFYEAQIDGLLARGIAPHATLYHWDLPQALADQGGWENPDIAGRLADYAVAVERRLGDRLASLATINEPWCVAWLSHFLGHHAPGKKDIGSASRAMHNVLYAQGTALEALRSEGAENCGIVLNMEYAQAASDKAADEEAARLHDGLYNRWFIQALTQGSYPEDVLEHLEPHLPDGWQAQMDAISAPLDWLGLNYYTRVLVEDDGSGQFPFGRQIKGPLPTSSMGWEIYPDGLEYFLNRLAKEYTGDLPLYVTENGLALHEAPDDPIRENYIKAHIAATLRARDKGAPVKGYFAWSLLDNFEWAFGYSERFGLVHVDYETQTRSPKRSYHALADLNHTRQFYDPEN